MAQSQRAFQSESFRPGEKIKPEEKKEAVILPFPQKAREYPEYKESMEAALDYQEYKNLGGTLSQKEYQDVLKCAEGDTAAAEAQWGKYAQPMVSRAGITLLPRVVTLYAVLRDKNQHPEKASYADLSDQKLLAEALRIAGDKSSLRSLDTFIEKYPHIFN